MESDDDFDIPVRTSPRFTCNKKNPKNKPVDGISSCTDSQENRPLKKLKTDLGSNNKKLKSKQKVGFKCAPHMLHDLFNSLDRDQRKWVEELGFGALLRMPKSWLPKDLTVWLIKHVIWKKKALVVGGRTIDIHPLIKKLLGIPDGPLPVPMPHSKRGKSNISNPTSEERAFKDEKAGRGLSYKITLDALKGNHEPTQFKRAFMLYVLCIYSAPSSGHVINRSYAPIVRNVELIKEMNWCDHVADFLIEGIRDYTQSKATNVNVHGCVHILLLIYIDLVKSPLIQVPEGTPRALFVTSDLLEQLDYHDLKFRTNDGPEYGKLEFIDTTVLDEAVENNNRNDHHSSTSREALDIKKIISMGLVKIESEYKEARERAYDDCFKLLRSKINKIDSIRSGAMSALIDTTCCSAEPPVLPTACSGRKTSGSQTNPSPRQQQHSSDFPIKSTDAKTPLKPPPVLIFSSDMQTSSSSGSQHPHELSFRIQHSKKLVHSSQPCVAQRDWSSPSLTSTQMVQDVINSHSSSGSDKSIDLQSRCGQFSTIVVRSRELKRTTSYVHAVRNLKLPEEKSMPSEEMTGTVENVKLGHLGPLCCDNMKEVTATSKEAERDVILEASQLPNSFHHSSSVDINNCCGLISSNDVQCGQQEQSSIGLNFFFSGIPQQTQTYQSQENHCSLNEETNAADPGEYEGMNETVDDINDEFVLPSDTLESAAASIESDDINDESGRRSSNPSDLGRTNRDSLRVGRVVNVVGPIVSVRTITLYPNP